MTLSAKEAIEYAAALLSETRKVREERLKYESVHGMYFMPKLPQNLTRDEAVYVLSPDVIHERRELVARVLGFETEIQCVPLSRTAAGTVDRSDQTAVDYLEKAGAVFLSSIDRHLVTKTRVTGKQCVEPLAIVLMEQLAIAKPDPEERGIGCRAYDVELDGCGWLEEEGIPTVFGRQYWQMLMKVEEQYSGRQDGPEGPGSRLAKAGTKFEWKPASDDFTPRTWPGSTTSDNFERCELVYLATADRIYHVALNEASEGIRIGPWQTGIGKNTKREGLMVWSGPNPFGRIPAFLIGSNVTAERELQERYLPYLLDLITTTMQENDIYSIRATAARNRAAPRDYVDPDPDLIKAYTAANNGQWPQAVEWADGKTPTLWGEVKSRPVEVDPDLDKVDARLQERKSRYTSGASGALRDPDVLKNATLGAQLAAYDSDNASLSILVGPQDTWQRQMLEAWESMIKWLGDEKNSAPGFKTGPQYAKFHLLSQGGELVTGKAKMDSGELFEITPKSFEVKHQWRVRTRQRTRGQAQAEFAAAVERMAPLPDGRPNVGIYEDLFAAVGASDLKERKSTLASEALMAEELDPLIKSEVDAAFTVFVKLDSGIPLDAIHNEMAAGTGGVPGAQPPPPPPGGGGAEMPNTGATTNSPVTEPTQGGSGPNIQGAGG